MTVNYQSVATELEAALKRQLALFKEVRDISASQKKFIEQGDADSLMQLVAEKQSRLDKISEIEQVASPLKQQREQDLDRWSPELRAKVDPLIRDLQATLGEIVKFEEEAREMGTAAANANTSRVSNIQRGKAMLNAYGKSSKSTAAARYSDKNG